MTQTIRFVVSLTINGRWMPGVILTFDFGPFDSLRSLRSLRSGLRAFGAWR